MRSARLAVATLVLAAAALVACSEDAASPDSVPCGETGAVSATVTTDGGLVFDWAPRCPLAFLLVEEDGADRWAISTDDQTWDDPDKANLIEPPVRYGVVPTGIDETEEASSLTEGSSYELILWHILPGASSASCDVRFDDACLLAVHTFTR